MISKSSQTFEEFIAFLLKFLQISKIDIENQEEQIVIKSSSKLFINKNTKLFHGEKLRIQHNRIKNLKSEENQGVFMLVLLLLRRGYPIECIELEKNFPAGHRHSGSLDLYMSDKKVTYMIEVKKHSELLYSAKKKNQQLFNYAFEDKNTKLISYFAYDFQNSSPCFKYIILNELMVGATSKKDLHDKWNKKYLENNFIANQGIFDSEYQYIKASHLKKIEKDDTHELFKKFTTILRINAVSDKSNAFNKIINMFLCKVLDETKEDRHFTIIDKDKNKHEIKGLLFQFVEGIDTPESLLSRLNDLYKEGVEQYLDKKIIDYNEEEIKKLLKKSRNEDRLMEIYRNLRLKKSNDFAFIEVYDNDSFAENFHIVKELVEIFSKFQFRYNYKHQYLGDFFEELLNTSLKQDEGQFFTPYPLVEFIVQSLDLEKFVLDKIKKREEYFLPKVIDYACGSGHFINCYIDEFQKILKKIYHKNDKATKAIKRNLGIYNKKEYSWVNKENTVGVEKDYRLAKTSKISTFLNGDGEATIINKDGLSKFSYFPFQENSFDFLLSNPPYAVKGFSKSLQNLKIDENDFTLYNQINLSDSSGIIEVLFIERAFQLLKDQGTAVILLPHSILTSDKYIETRNFLFSNFRIQVMLMLADISFIGTTTSPVVFFLRKEDVTSIDYKIMTIFSDKYLDTKAKRERERTFLGYKFSSNKDVATTQVIEDSILSSLIVDTRSFISSGEESENKRKYFSYPILKDIILNPTKQIFPKYNKLYGCNWIPIEEFFNVNPEIKLDENSNLKYVEIGSIKDDTITPSDKRKEGRVCKKGDMLIPSLTPIKEKIIQSDGNYIVSKAIFVLSVKENYASRQKELYSELREAYVIDQMNSLLEGFKITYGKISENNFKKHVKLNLKK